MSWSTSGGLTGVCVNAESWQKASVSISPSTPLLTQTHPALALAFVKSRRLCRKTLLPVLPHFSDLKFSWLDTATTRFCFAALNMNHKVTGLTETGLVSEVKRQVSWQTHGVCSILKCPVFATQGRVQTWILTLTWHWATKQAWLHSAEAIWVLKKIAKKKKGKKKRWRKADERHWFNVQHWHKWSSIRSTYDPLPPVNAVFHG